MRSDQRISRARRQAAIDRPELRHRPAYVKVEEKLPDVNRPVILFAYDNGQVYKLPFPCAFRGWDGVKHVGRWSNLKHDRALECSVVGWLYIA